jgi:hypothetical protein
VRTPGRAAHARGARGAETPALAVPPRCAAPGLVSRANNSCARVHTAHLRVGRPGRARAAAPACATRAAGPRVRRAGAQLRHARAASQPWLSVRGASAHSWQSRCHCRGRPRPAGAPRGAGGRRAVAWAVWWLPRSCHVSKAEAPRHVIASGVRTACGSARPASAVPHARDGLRRHALHACRACRCCAFHAAAVLIVPAGPIQALARSQASGSARLKPQPLPCVRPRAPSPPDAPLCCRSATTSAG